MWLRTGSSILACVLVSSCGDGESPWSVQHCDSCNWEAAEIEFVDAIPTDSVQFTGSIAIEYFNIANQKFHDSVTADRFYNDHQWRFRVTEQYDYYESVVRPILNRCKVPTTDTIRYRNVLFFSDSTNEYIVDAGPYRSKDGVLLFTPGKAPVFWTTDVFRNNCTDSTFVKCYFGK